MRLIKKFTILSCFIFVLCLSLLVLAGSKVYAADYYTEGSFQYTIKEDMVMIHSYFGSEEAVVIPAMIAELPVKGIDDYAFAGCHTVKSITIPDSVVALGDDAFAGAKNLEKIYNQSEAVTPKAGEQVLIIEDYPRYVYDRTQGDTNGTESTLTGAEASTQPEAGPEASAEPEAGAEASAQQEAGPEASAQPEAGMEASAESETNHSSSMVPEESQISDANKENGFQIEAEEVDDELGTYSMNLSESAADGTEGVIDNIQHKFPTWIILLGIAGVFALCVYSLMIRKRK